jgi:ketosteroid isomerase-like protein
MDQHRLDAEREIRALADRYTDAVNHRDWKTYEACWTEDAIWELGAPVHQRKVGRPAIMEEVKRAVGAMDLFVQMTHAGVILSVEGDRARARWTLNEIGRIRPEHRGLLGAADGMVILATYTDELVRAHDGGWRFAKRDYQVALFDGHAPRGEVYPIHDRDADRGVR